MKIIIPFVIILVVVIGCNEYPQKVITSYDKDHTDYSFLDDYGSEIMDSTDTSFMSISYIEKWREEYYGYQSSEYIR